MAYTIRKFDNSPLATIADGGFDVTATNLTLAGPNRVGYGQALTENLVYLLENFASNSAPVGTNLQGQLWFDKAHQTLNVFTSQGYSPVSGITVGSSFPVTQKDGDVFFNNSTNQLYISSAGIFDLVGPVYTKLQGVSGAIPATVADGSISGVTHNILQLQFGNTIVATFSTDLPFLPSPPMSGFTYINPGITLNSSITGPTFNSNVVGSLTGSVIGNVTGNVIGNVAGNVIGNVAGNLTGNVTATTVTGTLNGDVISTNGRITNLTSSNASVTGGNVTGLSSLTSNNATLTNLATTTLAATNLSVSNLVVAGGTIAGLASLSVTNLTATNFISGNAQLINGSHTNATALSATSGTFTNFSAGNVLISGGSINNIGGFSAVSVQTTNLATGNVLIAGGSATGLTNLGSTNGNIINFASSNVIVSGGNVSNVSGLNNTFTNANLINSTATTKVYFDSSTATATTAFVQGVFPRGMIVMWNSSYATIPTGWQLCDGSNGTPNLQGQFIVGATATLGTWNTPGNVGGTTSVTLTTGNLPSHTHLATLTGATDQGGAHNHTVIDPGHAHAMSPGYQTATNSGQTGRNDGSQSALITATQSAVTNISLAQAATHNHSLTVTGNIGVTGSGQSFGILPPYYALCYIQKMF
jgi:hypothetical protein